MAFSVTHRRILDNNIRNIYGGLPTEVRFRQPIHNKNQLNVPRRIHQQQQLPPERFNIRYYEYCPDYNSNIPRAPAFRQIPHEEVRTIVARLCRPKQYRNINNRPVSMCSRTTKSVNFEDDAFTVSNFSVYSKERSKIDIDNITKRVSTPTAVSKIRNKMRENGRTSKPELTQVCEKCLKPLSDRCEELLQDV